MSSNYQIKSSKIHVKDIFSSLWFRIPEYQRPYVWGDDEIDDLLEDLVFAHTEKPEQDYFLGSFVYQIRRAENEQMQEFDENDLLDGQQRMTTLVILFACIRDLSNEDDIKEACQSLIYQDSDQLKGTPERTRIIFATKKEAQRFVNDYIKCYGGTSETCKLEEKAKNSSDPSVKNMAAAVLKIRDELTKRLEADSFSLSKFSAFVCQKVLLIYVATEDLQDAFRLFAILNNRGVPLRNSDILKSANLGVLTDESEKVKFAELWEEAESAIGLEDDFDRFLNHIRTILLKDKARLNLLDEFERKIYCSTKSDGQPLLTKGKETFELVDRYLSHYMQLLRSDNDGRAGEGYKFDNLVKVMLTGLHSSDWIPPLLKYFDCFRYEGLFDFLVKVDNKFSSDWIVGYSPTVRIENMNAIIRAIESAETTSALLADCEITMPDREEFQRKINDALYGRRFTKYLLLKLDYLFADSGERMSLKKLSIEHVLPQNPKDGSQWDKDFTRKEQEEWIHRLGNLVLITGQKNTSLGNKDYKDKKDTYFKKRIGARPNSLRVLQNEVWTPSELQKNHKTVISKLMNHYYGSSA